MKKTLIISGAVLAVLIILVILDYKYWNIFCGKKQEKTDTATSDKKARRVLTPEELNQLKDKSKYRDGYIVGKTAGPLPQQIASK